MRGVLCERHASVGWRERGGVTWRCRREGGRQRGEGEAAIPSELSLSLGVVQVRCGA